MYIFCGSFEILKKCPQLCIFQSNDFLFDKVNVVMLSKKFPYPEKCPPTLSSTFLVSSPG